MKTWTAFAAAFLFVLTILAVLSAYMAAHAAPPQSSYDPCRVQRCYTPPDLSWYNRHRQEQYQRWDNERAYDRWWYRSR